MVINNQVVFLLIRLMFQSQNEIVIQIPATGIANRSSTLLSPVRALKQVVNWVQSQIGLTFVVCLPSL